MFNDGGKTLLQMVKKKAYYTDESVEKLVVNIADLVRVLRDCGFNVGDGRWILHDVQCLEQYECHACGTRYIEQQNKCCDEWVYCPACGSRNRE